MRIDKDEKFNEALKGAMHGDDAAMNTLMEIISPEITYIAFTVTKNYHDGEEAAQETAIRIMQHIHELNDPKVFETWMYRVTINTAIEMKRKIRNYFSLEDYSNTIQEEYCEFLPYEYAVEQEKRELLMAVINGLPLHHRSCILMHYYGDLSYRQIAEALDTTEKNIKNTLYQARKKIKKAIERKTNITLPSKVLLHSVLPVPVLSYAFWQDMEAKITPEIVERVMAGVQNRLAAGAVVQTSGGSAGGTSTMTAAQKAVIGITAASVVAVVGIAAGNNISKPVSEESSGAVVTKDDTVLPSYSPIPAPEEEAARVIETLEDLIGREHADELRSYVEDGVDADRWMSFLDAIGVRDRYMITADADVYVVYQVQEEDKQLIIIDKTGGQGDIEAVYRFGSVDEEIPKGMDVYFSFGEWRSQG